MPRSPHLEVLFLGKSELDADGILRAGVGHRQALVIRHILLGACQEPVRIVNSLRGDFQTF